VAEFRTSLASLRNTADLDERFAGQLSLNDWQQYAFAVGWFQEMQHLLVYGNLVGESFSHTLQSTPL
jgi:hypothetical protein